jgi:hypothetical protein
MERKRKLCKPVEDESGNGQCRQQKKERREVHARRGHGIGIMIKELFKAKPSRSLLLLLIYKGPMATCSVDEDRQQPADSMTEFGPNLNDNQWKHSRQ